MEMVNAKERNWYPKKINVAVLLEEMVAGVPKSITVD